MTLSAVVLSLLLCLLAVVPLQIKMRWKFLLAVPVFLAGMKSQILFRLGGGGYFFGPDVPGWLIAAGGWLYGVFIIFLLLLIPAGAVRFVWIAVLKLRRRTVSDRFRGNWNKVHAALLLLAAAGASAGIIQAVKLPEVKRIAITIPGKIPSSELKITVLSDLHADRLTGADKIRAIAERANAAGGDVIVIAGDFFDGNAENELLPLKILHAPYGVYAVPGNHEYYSGYKRWKSFMAAKLPGIKILENSFVTLPDGTVLAGITDPAAGGGRHAAQEKPDIARALHNAPENARRILLAHQPKTAAENAAHGVDLQISGHTHGGMVFGLDRFVKLLNSGFVSGSYQVGLMRLYVSNGSAIWNGFPLRLGHDSEITLISVRGK